MEYKSICKNCIYRNDCKPNFIYYKQSYTDLGVKYEAEVMRCTNYIPVRLVQIDREELRRMAQSNYDIKGLTKRLIKKYRDASKIRRNYGEEDSRT
jgi:hypothetical protein